MSDTPETDKHPLWHGEPAVHIDFARKLERERDAYKRAKQENDERFMLERDEAKREREAYRLLAIEYLKELKLHCKDPIHEEQLKSLLIS